MQYYNRDRDFQNPFEESEKVLKDTLGPSMRNTMRSTRVHVAE